MGSGGAKMGCFLCKNRLFFGFLVKFGQKWAGNGQFFAGGFFL
jgi:hypothetical protein